MPNIIEEILEWEGPQLASQVKRRLLERGYSEQAARQQISRARGSVRKFTAITFPKRESFIYLDEQYSSPSFWKALIIALVEKKTAYGIALQGLQARRGVIPASYFPIVSGCPDRPMKKQLNTDFVKERLLKIKLLTTIEVEGYGECLTFGFGKNLRTPDIARMSARILTEEILAKGLKDWLRKINLVSFHVAKTRSLEKQPSFDPFKWDLAGPCYLLPLVQKSADGKPRPGFVAADVFVDDELDEYQVQYFIKKCQMIRSQKNIPPFLAILVADRFSKTAFELGRKEGLMFATPENIFGTLVAEALRTFLDTMNRAAAIATGNPEKIQYLFDSLSRIEGAAGNLRGACFNLIAGNIIHNHLEGSIDIGKKVVDPSDFKQAEIDVFNARQNNQEIYAYECKGWLSPVKKEEIELWLTKKVPLIYRSLRAEKRFGNSKIHFEFWTSSFFEPDAIEYLEARRAQIVKKYTIDWKAGPEILELASGLRLTSIIEMLKENYLRHPLTLDKFEEQEVKKISSNKLLTTSFQQGEAKSLEEIADEYMEYVDF